MEYAKGGKAKMPKKMMAKKMDTPMAEPMGAPEGPAMMGGKARLRLDRPGRRLGGRVGADASPLSSANKSSHDAY